jgi:hypothetical protein
MRKLVSPFDLYVTEALKRDFASYWEAECKHMRRRRFGVWWLQAAPSRGLGAQSVCPIAFFTRGHDRTLRRTDDGQPSNLLGSRVDAGLAAQNS